MSTVMKFCESLDRFVKIRKLSDEEIKKIFKDANITDKKSYKRLVISACVVNYFEEIEPLFLKGKDYSLFGEIAEQELYNLCIKVNPQLDIKKISIELDDKETENKGIAIVADNEEKGEDMLTKLLNMEEYLSKKIIGQDEAIKVLSQAIRRAYVGLRNPRRPIGSFLFAGQTGVGKTAMAKALAEFLFGSEDDIVRIDCSEFSQPHEYSKLIGSPPGYVGYQEGGQLTEAVKNNPQCVVLFDEIEKAHQKVHNILLQILDDGILTDSSGEKVSFRDAVIIMTSNVGVEDVEEVKKTIGFGSHTVDSEIRKNATIKAIEKNFRPEFINRIDEIVVFKPLKKEHMLKIVDLMLEEEVLSRLRENLQMELKVPKSVKEFLVEKGFDPKYGARPLRRVVQKYVQSPLSEEIIAGKFKKGDVIKAYVDRKNEVIKFKLEKSGGGGKVSLEEISKMNKQEEKKKEKKKNKDPKPQLEPQRG